jgi:hypothetical protein
MMRYRVLATDYDGTLATHGKVDDATIESLRRLINSRRKLLLVTGRELPDLLRAFPQVEMFDLVVAENGALLYDPKSRRETLLCEPAARTFVSRLRERGVPISVGRAVVATDTAHEQAVRDTIWETGLDLQISLNKGSVMVLPFGVNKASGLSKALEHMHISPSAVVAVGDGENDAEFLRACGCAAAVANALPQIKANADFVTSGTHGAGVSEVVDQLLANDLLACDTGHSSLRSEFSD